MPAGELEAAYSEADFFVRGQGEMAMVQLACEADVERLRRTHIWHP